MPDHASSGARLMDVSILDRDHLAVTYSEGEVLFRDDADGPSAMGSTGSAPDENTVVCWGELDTAAAADPANWTVSSPDDPAYGGKGRSPERVFRKTKINGMAQVGWNESVRDHNYETTLDHTLWLKLPSPLQAGMNYRLAVSGKVDRTAPERALTFDICQSRSEAVHANLVGYPGGPSIKSADLYCWLGDGGARDYTAFEGNKVWLYDVDSGKKREAGRVRLWMRRGPDLGQYDFTASDVWAADFGPVPEGIWRVAIEGVGASRDFRVAKTIYKVPYQVSVRGFYYMRIGEVERPDIRPIPRQPPYIPGVDPADTRVVITTMHPWHPEWKTFSRGDVWDGPKRWEPFAKAGTPENTKAKGGHSDALDWDRHLGHVSIIYDMLYPFLLTCGVLADDDCEIAESGNGIPDILDEARNEVDFWLGVRDGEGYGHGLTNPTRDHVFYQAANTTMAAWANAVNCAMLAAAFRMAKREDLAGRYLAEAEKAYRYASAQPDQQLEDRQNVGHGTMRGKDFQMTAAAFLFDLTGEEAYEDTVNELSLAVSDTADIIDKDSCQVWATAGYLLSGRKCRYPELRERMRKAVMHNAIEKEVGLLERRPSRRSSGELYGYNWTAHNVHRTILAHRFAGDPALKARLLDALILEADFGLGRNPLNMVQMTTATTPLAALRSVVNAFTSGRNDGTPGLHPGHTPYFNMDDWGRERGMIMARPSWMAARGYPEFARWPRGECCFNTRFVWAHGEFTPQQTMRGKMALYGYLYGLGLGTTVAPAAEQD